MVGQARVTCMQLERPCFTLAQVCHSLCVSSLPDSQLSPLMLHRCSLGFSFQHSDSQQQWSNITSDRDIAGICADSLKHAHGRRGKGSYWTGTTLMTPHLPNGHPIERTPMILLPASIPRTSLLPHPFSTPPRSPHIIPRPPLLTFPPPSRKSSFPFLPSQRTYSITKQIYWSIHRSRGQELRGPNSISCQFNLSSLLQL